MKENIKGIKRNDEEKLKIIQNITKKKGCNVIFDCVGSSEFENVIIIKYISLIFLEFMFFQHGL